MRALCETVRQKGNPQVIQDRIKGKGRGKEVLIRWEGEVVEGEAEVVPKDPRKRKEGGDDSRTKSGPGPGSKVREVFYEMKPYEVRIIFAYVSS